MQLKEKILSEILTLDTMLCHFMYLWSYHLSPHIIFKNSEEKYLSLSRCGYISLSCHPLLVQHEIRLIRSTDPFCCIQMPLVSQNPADMPPSPNHWFPRVAVVQVSICLETPAIWCDLFICLLSPRHPLMLSCWSGRSHYSASHLPKFALLCIPACACSQESLYSPGGHHLQTLK